NIGKNSTCTGRSAVVCGLLWTRILSRQQRVTPVEDVHESAAQCLLFNGADLRVLADPDGMRRWRLSHLKPDRDQLVRWVGRHSDQQQRLSHIRRKRERDTRTMDWKVQPDLSA